MLHRAIVGGGAVAAGAVVGLELADDSLSAPSPAQDIRILNFALQLEYVQARLYEPTSGTMSPSSGITSAIRRSRRRPCASARRPVIRTASPPPRSPWKIWRWPPTTARARI
jgi:hypothetical protein